MPDPIDLYLDQIMEHARLAKADARRVRAELQDHLFELFPTINDSGKTPQETLAMLNNEFGNPAALGHSIRISKGRFRTWLKRQARRLPVAIAAILILGFAVRASVAEVFRIPGNSVSPILISGSRCVVYKLASHYGPQDVIVYKPADHPELRFAAIVTSVDQATGTFHATRNGIPEDVPRSAVIGRVVLSTR